MPTFDRYISAQLHCHSSIEGPASIGAHCYEAQRAGLEVVWITDHDTRISLNIGGPFIDRFDFESPEIWSSVERLKQGGREGRIGVGWAVTHQDPGFAGGAALTKETCYRGTQSLRLEGAVDPKAPAHVPTTGPETEADEWQYLMLDFRADSKMHSRPLFAGARLGIAVHLDEASEQDAEAWLDLTLTEQPPDLKQGRLRYFIWGDPATHQTHPRRDETYSVRPLPLKSAPGAWTRHEIDPAKDAAGNGLDGHSLGGRDNALTGVRLTLRVRNFGRIRLHVDDLTIAHEVAGNDLRTRQRAIAHELAEKHGVVCHVAQEISWAGQHKNAWGIGVPLLDYAATPGGFSHAHGVEWARSHGGVFSLNHPFNRFNNATDLDDLRRGEIVEEMIQTYVGSGASGANTLEVGFPAGRHNFPLDYYFRLWDGLSRAGIVIAGSGSSDAHSARVGWQKGNNFATHIRADSTDEEALLAGLRARDLYPADPIRFRSRLSYGDNAGHRMGEAVMVRGVEERVASLTLERAKPEWSLVWVLNGERQAPVPLGEGSVTETLRFSTRTDKPTWVRAEIWDPTCAPEGTPLERPAASPLEGRCVAFTNPIWYLPPG